MKIITITIIDNPENADKLGGQIEAIITRHIHGFISPFNLYATSYPELFKQIERRLQ